MTPAPIGTDFGELFEARGSLEMRYSPRAAALSGQPVEMEGFLVRLHGEAARFLLVDAPGQCPDCSAAPVPAIFLPELRAAPAGLSPGGGSVRVRGTLRFGFEVGPDGHASFLRIESATAWATPPPGGRHRPGGEGPPCI